MTRYRRGIGLAVTTILLEQLGALVVAISRTRSPELVELLKKYNANLLTIECNVFVIARPSIPVDTVAKLWISADEGALTRAIGLAEKTYHHIDGLILNAGTLDPMGPITSASTSLGDWKQHFDVNFFSLITALRAAVPALRKSDLGGRVVFVSSGSAVGGMAGWAPYNASKAAMNSLCRSSSASELIDQII
jgi:NAD(P)-dependent dehydrogenase (short-subunit alcohol dehydrogenase family)